MLLLFPCTLSTLLWVGNDLMLSYGIVITMTLLFFVQTIRKIWVLVKDAAGIWREDKYRPLITAGANLLMNVISVRYIGLYGIMLSTIIAEAFISVPWLWKNLFKYVLPVDNSKYRVDVFKYSAVCLICCFITCFICRCIALKPFPALIIYGVISVVIPNAIMLICYRNLKEFQESALLVKKMIKRV